MPNPEKFNSKIEIGPEAEGEKGPLYKGPLTEEERKEFSFFIEGIKGEQDKERRERRLEMLIPHLLGRRLEERLREEGKKIIQSPYEGRVLRKGGYEWKRGEEEEEEELRIWRIYKETENRWRSETITLDKKEFQRFKEELLKEILE